MMNDRVSEKRETSCLLSVLGGAVLSLLTAGSSMAEDVKIGFVTSLSGAGSLFAEAAVQGVELAIQEVNQSGGVLGGKLSMDVVDDATDPTTARQAWENLASRQVKAILSAENSANRVAGLPVAERENIPVLYAVDYEGGGCSPVMYINGEVPGQKVPAYIDFLIKKAGGKKFFMLSTDYNWARTAFAYARKEVERQGGTIVGEEYTPFNTPDYTALISKIRNSGANVLLSGLAGGPDNVTFWKQARASGLRITAGSLALDDTTLAAVGSAARDSYMATSYFSAVETEGNKKFIAALKAKYGEKVKPQGYLSQASYDAIHLYAAAVNKAGSTEPRAVLKALSEVSFDGPRGKIAMNTDRHAPLPIYIAQATEAGTFKVVEDLGVQPVPKQCDPEPPFGTK
jgi:branched-chain amino acid transport system substrate-binding protein